MSKELLRRYIRLALGEAAQARVPNQLLVADDTSDDPPEEGIDELNAIAACGLMGHAGGRSAGDEEDDG